MVQRFRLIEHTADTGLIAFGKDLPEAYANAAFGMFSIMADLNTVKEVETRTIEVHEEDLESLLFEWLNRLLFFFDAEMLLLKRFDIVEFEETRLKAICYGEKHDPKRHRQIKIGVKSATYHTLTVDKEKHQVQVIFDI